jgi:hypothetical protein
MENPLYQGPVVLDSLEVKISSSLKELFLKPLLEATVSSHFLTIGGSHQTPGFHSFPNSHRNGIL